jgi:hypothetical protein
MFAELSPGTHVVTPRGWYSHHGIYTGGGRVVHYAGFNRVFVGGPVEEVSMDQFARGCAIEIRLHPCSPFRPEEIVARARARLGERRYALLRNNCEHFTEWCISGEARSPQIENLLAWPLALTGMLLARWRERMVRMWRIPRCKAAVAD